MKGVILLQMLLLASCSTTEKYKRSPSSFSNPRIQDICESPIKGYGNFRFSSSPKKINETIKKNQISLLDKREGKIKSGKINQKTREYIYTKTTKYKLSKLTSEFGYPAQVDLTFYNDKLGDVNIFIPFKNYHEFSSFNSNIINMVKDKYRFLLVDGCLSFTKYEPSKNKSIYTLRNKYKQKFLEITQIMSNSGEFVIINFSTPIYYEYRIDELKEFIDNYKNSF